MSTGHYSKSGATNVVIVDDLGNNIAIPAQTGTISSVADAAVSTTILAANTSRQYFTVYNDSTATLYLALSDTIASTTVYSVKVPPDGYFECDYYQGRVAGIWSVDASGSARVTEFV